MRHGREAARAVECAASLVRAAQTQGTTATLRVVSPTDAGASRFAERVAEHVRSVAGMSADVAGALVTVSFGAPRRQP